VQDIVAIGDHYSSLKFNAEALNAFKLLPLDGKQPVFSKMLQELEGVLKRAETPGAEVATHGLVCQETEAELGDAARVEGGDARGASQSEQGDVQVQVKPGDRSHITCIHGTRHTVHGTRYTVQGALLV
jgi:hypothetical protein